MVNGPGDVMVEVEWWLVDSGYWAAAPVAGTVSKTSTAAAIAAPNLRTNTHDSCLGSQGCAPVGRCGVAVSTALPAFRMPRRHSIPQRRGLGCRVPLKWGVGIPGQVWRG